MLILTNTGEVYGWGYNDCGQLGIGAKSQDEQVRPTEMRQAILSGIDVKAIEIASHEHSAMSAAITANGQVYLWGAVDNHLWNLNYDRYIWKPRDVNLKSLDTAFAVAGHTHESFRNINRSREAPYRFNEAEMYFNDSMSSDCTLLIGQRKIYAHKYVLTSKSEYFRLMLKPNTWRESKSSDAISLPTEFGYQAFCLFIKALYTNNELDTNCDLSTCLQLLELLQFVNYIPLIDQCVRMIQQKIDPDNFFQIYTLAKHIGNEPLIRLCKDYYTVEMLKIHRSQSYLELFIEENRDIMSSLLDN